MVSWKMGNISICPPTKRVVVKYRLHTPEIGLPNIYMKTARHSNVREYEIEFYSNIHFLFVWVSIFSQTITIRCRCIKKAVRTHRRCGGAVEKMTTPIIVHCRPFCSVFKSNAVYYLNVNCDSPEEWIETDGLISALLNN